MKRRVLAGRRVIVTGASSGIGLALARQLVARGCRVLITARRGALLEACQPSALPRGGSVDSLVGDVTDGDFPERLLDAAATQLGGLDILINNAGVGAVGPFSESTPDRLRRIMEVNFFAPCELIRRSLPLLQHGRSPLVVNMGSVLGYRAVPDKSEYCASKFALRGLSQALRPELRRLGIELLLVSPSTTSSAFFASLLENRGGCTANPWAMTPEQVARQTIRGIEHGRSEMVLSWSGWGLVWLDRLLPTITDRLVARLALRTRAV